MHFILLGLAAFALGAVAHSSEGSDSGVTTTTTTITTTTAMTTTTTTVTLPCSSSATSPASEISSIVPCTGIPSTSAVLPTSLAVASAAQCTAVISPPPTTITETEVIAPGSTTTKELTVDGPYCTCGPRIAGLNITIISNTAYTWCADITAQTVGSSVVNATAPVSSYTGQPSAIPSLTGPSGTSTVNATGVSPSSPAVYTGAAVQTGSATHALALGALGAALAML